MMSGGVFPQRAIMSAHGSFLLCGDATRMNQELQQLTALLAPFLHQAEQMALAGQAMGNLERPGKSIRQLQLLDELDDMKTKLLAAVHEIEQLIPIDQESLQLYGPHHHIIVMQLKG